MAREAKHMVNGRWMTTREVAGRFGVAAHTIDNWRRNHRQANGKPGLMQDYWNYRMRVERGERRLRPGKPGARQRVNGKMMSAPEAAEMLGVRYRTLWAYMHRKRCSLEKAVRYYDEQRTERAVRDIVWIICGKNGKGIGE